jgi:hypothetical protein
MDKMLHVAHFYKTCGGTAINALDNELGQYVLANQMSFVVEEQQLGQKLVSG